MNPLLIALNEYGTKEIKGILHNTEVLKYFKDIGQKQIKDDETAWCAAFVNWVLMKAHKMTTGSLMARSFLKYGIKTKTPEIGDVVVLWRISPTSPYGHVGFFIKETKDKIYILGGNQSDEVNITAFPKSQLLSYRKAPLAHNA
jgi:uncharacterized protein (TIGR02594 family)